MSEIIIKKRKVVVEEEKIEIDRFTANIILRRPIAIPEDRIIELKLIARVNSVTSTSGRNPYIELEVDG